MSFEGTGGTPLGRAPHGTCSSELRPITYAEYRCPAFRKLLASKLMASDVVQLTASSEALFAVEASGLSTGLGRGKNLNSVEIEIHSGRTLMLEYATGLRLATT